MINSMLRSSNADRFLILDADIVLPMDMICYLFNNYWWVKHASATRCLLPREETDKILLGDVYPGKQYGDLIVKYSHKITKWGNIIRNYDEEPALGYFQWVEGHLARWIGYPSKFNAYSGSDDGFSLNVMKELGIREVPMIEDKPVLHLDHGRSNWKGLETTKWL